MTSIPPASAVGAAVTMWLTSIPGAVSGNAAHLKSASEANVISPQHLHHQRLKTRLTQRSIESNANNRARFGSDGIQEVASAIVSQL